MTASSAAPGLVGRDGLRGFLYGLPGVDRIGADQRAAELGTRSIKTTAKAWAIDMAISRVDLTTLEGADTPGKVAAMCAKAIHPDPSDPSAPKVAAVCVYSDLVGVAAEAVRGSGVKVASVATTLYLPGMEVTKNNATGQISATRYYKHNGEVIATRGNDGSLHWLHTDPAGTPLLAVHSITDQMTRRAYTPYGQPRSSQGGFPGEKGFVGGAEDPALSTTHLGAREYAPALGRFTSVDPLIDTADPRTLAGAYGYGYQNPVTYPDPDGLKPLCGRGCEWTPDGTSYHYNYLPGKARSNHTHSWNQVKTQHYYKNGYHTGINPTAKTGQGRTQYNHPAWTPQQKKKSRIQELLSGIGNEIESSFSHMLDAIDSAWTEHKTLIGILGFVACLTVTAGACLAIGAGVALGNYLSSAHGRGLDFDFFNRRHVANLAVDGVLSFGGGYFGKALPTGNYGIRSGWNTRVINRRWPRGRFKHATVNPPMNGGRTAYGVSVNGAGGAPGLYRTLAND